MTGFEWRKSAEKRLAEGGNADAVLDAKLLLAYVLEVELNRLALRQFDELTAVQLLRLEKMLLRRLNGEPEQYIEGRAWFMGNEFKVDSRVLIPRQDTEILCEFALEEIKSIHHPQVLDLCTGSGALAVSIAKLRPDSRVTASDISEDALEVAKSNAQINDTDIRLLCGDGFAPLCGESFDYMVCNPPYLTQEDMDELQTEVKCEPALALFGGKDGLDIYRRFIAQLPLYLKAGGGAAFEVGMGQAQDVCGLLSAAFPKGETGIIKDLNEIDRVVYLRTK